MKFVSYAQNFEDVILWRSLKNISKGFYVDVGANDPIIDSVTKAFYDRGWKGINIDPSPKAYERLYALRPRDINLNIAIGDVDGKLMFYDIAVSGWSTLDKDVAQKHQQDGVEVKERTVDVKKLLDICKTYAPEQIHFLKVDVEGAEALVFKGMEFSEFRPWIIVVEATLPNSPIVNYKDWEPKIVKNGYEFVYFDGLNRFYIAQEHLELKENFLLPPNVFDDFILFMLYELEEQIVQEQQTARLAALEAEVKIHEARTGEHLAHMQLKAFFESKSWKITAPLRFLGRIAKKIKSKSVLKDLVKKSFIRLANNETLKTIVKKIFVRFPYIGSQIKKLYFYIHPEALSSMQKYEGQVFQDIHLSIQERSIKEKLESALHIAKR